MREVTTEWVAKAENDFIVAERESIGVPVIYDAVCFHSQQCVEKYFKAVLQENEVYFEKTHDLDILLEKCKDFIPELYRHKNEIIELSSYAVEVRYPGIQTTEEEAKSSVLIAGNIRNIVRTYLSHSQK